MGARPLGFTWALAAPADLSVARLDGLIAGLLREASTHRCPLIGGNVTSAGETILTLTVLGAAPRGQVLTRRGVRTGDRIYVTGALGGAAFDVARALRGTGRVRHVATPRLAAGRVLATLAGGGTWINVGAGTSGRIGVLDASEIPPTFGLSPKRVQGVIAGGEKALRTAVEGAEDNFEAGSWALRELGLGMGDAVVAISASGTTPYVLGAIQAAHDAGARSIGISCDPNSPLAEAVEISIAPRVGPVEIETRSRIIGQSWSTRNVAPAPSCNRPKFHARPRSLAHCHEGSDRTLDIR